MARLARVMVSGMPHHVTQRGNRSLPRSLMRRARTRRTFSRRCGARPETSSRNSSRTAPCRRRTPPVRRTSAHRDARLGWGKGLPSNARHGGNRASRCAAWVEDRSRVTGVIYGPAHQDARLRWGKGLPSNARDRGNRASRCAAWVEDRSRVTDVIYGPAHQDARLGWKTDPA